MRDNLSNSLLISGRRCIWFKKKVPIPVSYKTPVFHCAKEKIGDGNHICKYSKTKTINNRRKLLSCKRLPTAEINSINIGLSSKPNYLAQNFFRHGKEITHWCTTTKIAQICFGCFPFVRTDQPDHSRRDEKFTFNHNYAVRSVKF